MDRNEMEQRRARIVKRVKFGLGGLAVVLSAGIMAPLILAGVQALLALTVAAVVGGGIIVVAPVVAMKVANWRLRAIKTEAMQNPVETLQNVYVEKRVALANFSASITDFATEVGNFSDKVKEFEKVYPQDVEKFREQLKKMKQLLEMRRQNYEQAKHELALFENEISRASAIWDMAQAAIKMNAAAGTNEADIIERIKAETAVDSVQSSLNRAFAELETSLAEAPITTTDRFQKVEAPVQKVGAR